MIWIFFCFAFVGLCSRCYWRFSFKFTVCGIAKIIFEIVCWRLV